MRDPETIAREVLDDPIVRRSLPAEVLTNEQEGGARPVGVVREAAARVYIRLMAAAIEADRKERK